MSAPPPAARRAVAYALIPPGLWLAVMGTVASFAPGIPTDFRSHLLFGLGVFCVIILGPLLLLLATLNWIVRRVVGLLMGLLFVGMVRGGLSQGFGLLADTGIVLVSGLLVGSTLFLLSRSAVRAGVGDHYNFLSLRDVMSASSFRRVGGAGPSAV